MSPLSAADLQRGMVVRVGTPDGPLRTVTAARPVHSDRPDLWAVMFRGLAAPRFVSGWAAFWPVPS